MLTLVTKRSHILKETCSFELQVCLSICDFFVTTRHYRVNLANVNVGDQRTSVSEKILSLNNSVILVQIT